MFWRPCLLIVVSFSFAKQDGVRLCHRENIFLTWHSSNPHRRCVGDGIGVCHLSVPKLDLSGWFHDGIIGRHRGDLLDVWFSTFPILFKTVPGSPFVAGPWVAGVCFLTGAWWRGAYQKVGAFSFIVTFSGYCWRFRGHF